jgi:hypothetical protein
VKSFFSSRVSKFNALMTLCALGVNTFSCPAMGAPQEVCVRTSAGDITCGTPVSRSAQTNSNKKVQTQASGEVVFELMSCVRGSGNVVICTLSLSTQKDKQYSINLGPRSRLVDSSGNEYHAGKVQIGDRIANRDQTLYFNMADGAKYRTTVEFTDVPDAISQAVLVQIADSYGGAVQFRKVPIN